MEFLSYYMNLTCFDTHEKTMYMYIYKIHLPNIKDLKKLNYTIFNLINRIIMKSTTYTITMIYKNIEIRTQFDLTIISLN